MIERSPDNANFSRIATVAGTTVLYQDDVLVPSNTYYYRVWAANGISGSPYSSVTSATTLTPVWQPLSPGTPTPGGLVNMGGTNALVTNQLVICAGDDISFPATNNQTWTLKFSGPGSPAWTQQAVGTNPGVRSNPGVAYDPTTQNVILMGGLDQSNPASPVFKNDVWVMSQSAGVWSWNPVTTAGTPPSGRFGHAVAFSGTKLFVIGGQDANAPPNDLLNDVWVLDFALATPRWSLLFSSSPMAPRAFHTAILDTGNAQIVVFGGFDGTFYRNDTWTLSLAIPNTWTPIFPQGILPPGRSNTSAVYHLSAKAMIVFGGNFAAGSANDVWMLPLSGAQPWNHVFPSGTPPGVRGGHVAIFDDASGRMILFGGMDVMGSTPTFDVWQLQF
jgi:hypothetical protein